MTGVLMPAGLTDPNFRSMLDYLHLKGDPLALKAAALLEEDTSTET